MVRKRETPARWPVRWELVLVKTAPLELPPEGHPRRCQGINRRRRDQCRKWALHGRNFCKTHRGTIKPYKDMGGFFSKHAGDALKRRLAAVAQSEQERLSLSEEVDVARLVALDSMQLWEAAQQSDNPATRGQACELVRQSIDHITETVKRAATVRQLVGANVAVEDVGYVVAQVQKILNDELGGSEAGRAVLERLTARIDEIKLPEHDQPPPLSIVIQ